MKHFVKIGFIILSMVSTCVFSSELLVGKTTEHVWSNNDFPTDWPAPKYKVIFCDSETLVWNNITNIENINSGVEKYSVVELGENLIQVSWKESPETTNYGIIWTLNFKTSDIYGVLVNIDPGKNYVVSGKFDIKKGTKVAAPLKGCP